MIMFLMILVLLACGSTNLTKASTCLKGAPKIKAASKRSMLSVTLP
eukprot:CAMPEP_0182515428 /NCGR_PEP_ID=MMETSP1321-20130603/38060_1 /TAXON_ID=91990 /ORGANISM="Bolidomonas sp., Strain RCC1657" /LENGTH=45 /DNA_ID= /DNA_START= /DNA_END= /DNA_ORIENTATION=